MGNREDAILLASYNGEKYIAEQIESLLAQTEAEWELFVHDDGSADRTLEVLRCYEAWYPDRIHVLYVTDERLHPVAGRLSAYQKLDPGRTKEKELMIQNVVTGCTVMINRALAALATRPENITGIIMHDWWCALIGASFGAVSYVDRALVLYRQHGGNFVGAKNLNSLHLFEFLHCQEHVQLLRTLANQVDN